MKQLMIIFTVFMIAAVFTTNSFAFTTNEFRVLKQENVNVYRIDSFPEEMNDIPKPNFPHALLCYTRENGKWCESPIAAGLLTCNLTNEKIETIKKEIKALQKALDKTLKPHVLVSFAFIVCYHDAVIYINDNHIQDDLKLTYHSSICQTLNIERQRYFAFNGLTERQRKLGI